jgi:hypothetical protein
MCPVFIEKIKIYVIVAAAQGKVNQQERDRMRDG